MKWMAFWRWRLAQTAIGFGMDPNPLALRALASLSTMSGLRLFAACSNHRDRDRGRTYEHQASEEAGRQRMEHGTLLPIGAQRLAWSSMRAKPACLAERPERASGAGESGSPCTSQECGDTRLRIAGRRRPARRSAALTCSRFSGSRIVRTARTRNDLGTRARGSARLAASGYGESFNGERRDEPSGLSQSEPTAVCRALDGLVPDGVLQVAQDLVANEHHLPLLIQRDG